MNTILNQPYRRRVSTDRLNRDDSQLAASLEGEPGPTPAGKTLPHSYPETRFRRERARGRCPSACHLLLQGFSAEVATGCFPVLLLCVPFSTLRPVRRARF